MVTEVSIFDRPAEVPEDLEQRAREKSWPHDLLRRALELRVPRASIEWWLTHEDHSVGDIARYLDRRERLMYGTMRVREATWADDEALADLYANAPEDIGDWEVTVERGPYPFAQFRLQENANIQVLEDRGIVLAAAAHSGRNTIIDGKRTTTHIASAWRVRREFRGQGMSNLLRTAEGPACAWFGMVSYWYVRSGNVQALDWIKALRPDLASAAGAEAGGELPGIPVTVHHLRARPFQSDASGIRPARRADTRACLALINRTHRGQDFFRPYTGPYLHQRLDDPSWGPKPPFWVPVYGWHDYFVLEEDGRVVACGGLWDRGRHIREVWRHKSNGERFVIERTALMDFGYAEGREDAMARLMAFFVGRTHELGRQELMAALEQLPALVARLAAYQPTTETRTMGVDAFGEGDVRVEVAVRRPYTDLAYW